MRKCLLAEIDFRTSRSSGPGGQHVNKTESRVELLWMPSLSVCLNDRQKFLVEKALASRLTDQGLLILASEKFRSQHRNREDVSERFLKLVLACLAPPKKRIPTRPTHSSREKRIKKKKSRGEVKRLRKDPPSE